MFCEHALQVYSYSDYGSVYIFLYIQDKNSFLLHTFLLNVRHKKQERFVGVHLLQMKTLAKNI